MPPVLVVAVRCVLCGKSHRPDETIAWGEGSRLCWQCFEWHCHAVLVLSGQACRGCQNCGASAESLKAASPDGELRMWVHAKDGVYALLCPKCSEAYEQANRGLYRDTPYGWARKLK